MSGLGFPWLWFLHLQRGLGRWAELALKTALLLRCALGKWLGLAKPHWLQNGAPGRSTLRLNWDGMRSYRQSAQLSAQQRSSGRGRNPRMNLVLWWPTQAAQRQMRKKPVFPPLDLRCSICLIYCSVCIYCPGLCCFLPWPKEGPELQDTSPPE